MSAHNNSAHIQVNALGHILTPFLSAKNCQCCFLPYLTSLSHVWGHKCGHTNRQLIWAAQPALCGPIHSQILSHVLKYSKEYQHTLTSVTVDAKLSSEELRNDRCRCTSGDVGDVQYSSLASSSLACSSSTLRYTATVTLSFNRLAQQQTQGHH